MRLRFCCLLFLILPWLQAHGATRGDLKFLKSVPLGGEGGWDCLSVDSGGRRLYVTHASKIIVIDLDQDKPIGEIANTPGVHAFAVAPELARGFSSNGKEARVSVVDLKTLKTVAQIETGEGPDIVLYEPARSEVYVFNGRGNSATVIDARTNKVVATVPLPGKPEFAACDSTTGRVFCNIEDKNEIAVIDAKTHAIVASWPLAPNEEPTGMAFDPVHHRLFVTCGNKVMAMIDSASGKIVASVPIGAGADGCAFDEATHLAFASCGDGTLIVAKEETPDRLVPFQTLKTERGARTLALDPKTHRIYTVTAEVAPEKGSPPPAGQRRWPSYVAETFHLLVYGPE